MQTVSSSLRSLRATTRVDCARHIARQSAGRLLSPLGLAASRRYSSTEATPAEKPFLIHTAGTPNGKKVSVFLEELKDAYGVEYDVNPINIGKNTQKEPWFLALNPNGRIPVLIDRERGGFPVFETGAILLYLARRCDTAYKFSFNPQEQEEDFSTILQWMFWAHGGLGPMQGQLNHFGRFAPEDIPYAKKRYLDETERLYGVLELRLAQRDFLAGPGRGKYTIADMNAFPWVAGHSFSGIESLEKWPGLNRWVENLKSRAQVQKGMSVP